MIYFHQSLVANATKALEEAHELLDIKNDVTEIDTVTAKIRNCVNYENLKAAQDLDRRLRKKYSIIEVMLTIADQMLPPSLNVGYAQKTEIQEISQLMQDRCGILCHVLIKKKLISKIEDFIEKVD